MDTKANSQGRRHAWIGAFAAALAIVSLPAAATIYKCQGASGAPVYQDEPCPSGKELRNFQNDPPEITVLPGVSGAATGGAPATTDDRSCIV